mmetsp:Transcript_5784/g.9710  ORF Transcript_5784/g.9710 Transcript_5784/m.9710 type:complete len:291 (+) Transcript_5784:156-1028(+)|eukprot:CAMPEP_0119300032 /NCGR_PEP_ID=MMETSP1333-20130426/2027_1 /TAXON_ID=418940 /ORGANISM="Scyphosphaera apsteinii, Strain RCC1455" /LENGTH=290 /DNA_ID=CAMNT_0007301651 /DNA_START=143 /DNA_END=1015 /DNA_ORIENTATION=+
MTLCVPKEGSCVTREGHSISYRLAGPDGAFICAPRMCFIAGLGAYCTIWEQQLNHFRAFCEVLLLDNRDIGMSGDPGGWCWTIDSMACDVLDVFTEIGWDTHIHLVGHSMGALICRSLLSRAPEGQIGSITMISASSTHKCWPWRLKGVLVMIQLLCADNWEQRLMAVMRLNYPTRWLEQGPACDGWSGTNRDAMVRATIRQAQGNRRISQATMLRQFFAVLRFRAGPLPRQGLRVLYVAGEGDVLIDSSPLRKLCSEHSEQSVLLLPNAGHNCFLQCPTQVNAAIESLM